MLVPGPLPPMPPREHAERAAKKELNFFDAADLDEARDLMKAGLLVESGTHDELFVADGVYADLVRRQTRIGREDSQSLLSMASSNSLA